MEVDEEEGYCLIEVLGHERAGAGGGCCVVGWVLVYLVESWITECGGLITCGYVWSRGADLGFVEWMW